MVLKARCLLGIKPQSLSVCYFSFGRNIVTSSHFREISNPKAKGGSSSWSVKVRILPRLGPQGLAKASLQDCLSGGACTSSFCRQRGPSLTVLGNNHLQLLMVHTKLAWATKLTKFIGWHVAFKVMLVKYKLINHFCIVITRINSFLLPHLAVALIQTLVCLPRILQLSSLCS